MKRDSHYFNLKVIFAIFFFLAVSGCAIFGDTSENIAGSYMKGLQRKTENVRSQVFDYGIHGCFDKVVYILDDMGAKIIKVISVKGHKTVKGRISAAGIGDLILASVKKGKVGVRKTVVPAVIVRQKKEYRRPDGTRIKFEDNAAVVLKDMKGNPQGTILKGAIAKEACQRWPGIAKLATIVV